jgi:hypothetical protein
MGFEESRGQNRGGFGRSASGVEIVRRAAMLNLRMGRLGKQVEHATNSKFAAWQDRAYFLAGYFTGLAALGLIVFSIFGHFDLSPKTRERAGWDLSQPEKIAPRIIGQ